MMKNVTLLAFSLLLLSFSGPGTLQTFDGKRYTFSYPSTWEAIRATENQAVDMYIYPPEDNDNSFVENINILSVDMAGNKTSLQEIADKSKEEIVKSYSQVNFISDQKLTGKNGDFHELLYTATWSGKKIKIRQHYFYKKGFEFILTFSALESTFAKSDADVGTIFKSFRIK